MILVDMLTGLIVNALAFYIIAYLVPGIVIANMQVLVVIAVVWGILSLILKPILVVLTLPVNFMTLGLFTFVINAFLMMLMSRIVNGFSVDGFGTALIASVVLALVNMVLSKLK